MKKLAATGVLLALALVAVPTSAKSSSPASGDWSGTFKGVSPKTALTFTVGNQGKSRRVIGFASNGSFKVPCSSSVTLTTVSAIPSAKVSSAGKFKAVGSAFQSFGVNTWTVSGKFTSKHAAKGTVAILIHTSPSTVCRHTVHWAASFEAPAPPVAGGHYTGATGKDSAAGGRPISFHVSANGKQLSGTFGTPLTCNGFADKKSVPGHNVTIKRGRFTLVFVQKTGPRVTSTYTITGRFLSGRRAVGTTVYLYDVDAGSQSVQCSSTNTWTAHA